MNGVRKDLDVRASNPHYPNMHTHSFTHSTTHMRTLLHQVVSVLADVLPTSTLSTKLRLVDPEVAAKMKAFLVQMQASLPQDKLAAAWGVLTPEKQAALQAVLQG